MLISRCVGKLKKYSFLIILLISCREEHFVINEIYDSPQIPMGFKIYAAFDGQVGLEWIPNNFSDTYYIYRSDNDTLNFRLINTTKEKFYVDSNLEYEVTYYYKIKAVNHNFKESGFTKILSAKPINIYSPTRPIIESINSINKNGILSITIKWTQLIDTDIDYYEVYKDTSENFYNMDIYYAKINATTFEDNKDLKPLQNYYYRIKAIDKGGLKSSATLSVKTKILDLPKLIYPPKNETVKKLDEVKFITCSETAKYKISIVENDTFISVYESTIQSNKIKEEVTFPINLNLISGKSYLWRVLAYFPNSEEANSITEYFQFFFE